ncbi:MAG: HEAT repeat domain-containing protein [Planctomycetota bacterium]|nr:HEAT repeat domain-containing protein [Planctomycetota bacterium]
MRSEILAHLSAFNDAREGIRQFAARKVASYGAEVAPLLIQLLRESQGFTQESAAMALKEMGQPAIPLLLEALENPEKAIRWQAAVILAAMGEQAHNAVRDSKRCIRLDHDESAAAS